jgi:hypothetical protein
VHPRHDTFPAELLLDLAADAIGISGAGRQSPLESEGICARHLPGIAHTKAQHYKSKFTLRAAAILHGGVDPGLLDEVQWWQTDDLWYWSLERLPCTSGPPPNAATRPSSSSAVGSPAQEASASREPSRRDAHGSR